MTPASPEVPAIESRSPRFVEWGVGMVPGRIATLAIVAIAIAAFAGGVPAVGVLLMIAVAPTLLSFLSLASLAREFRLRGSDLTFETHSGRAGGVDLATLRSVQALGRGQKLVQLRLVGSDGRAVVIDSRHAGLDPLAGLLLTRDPPVAVSLPRGVGRFVHFWDGADPTLRNWGRAEIEASRDARALVARASEPADTHGRFPWRLAVPNALGLLLVAVGAGQLVLGGPRIVAVAVVILGCGLLLFGYLPLRHLSRSLVVTDAEIQGRTLVGADVRIPHDGVSRLLVPGSSTSDTAQALLLGAEGQRLLIVRSGGTARGFDALVDRHGATQASFWETVTGFPISR